MMEEIRKQLFSCSDVDYLNFINKLGSTSSSNPGIGVRMPKVKQMTKEILLSGKETTYFQKITTFKGTLYREEIIIFGILLGSTKNKALRDQYLDTYVSMITTWETCDGPASTHKFYKQAQAEYFPYLLECLNSNQEYKIRYTVVVLMDYYLTDNYIDQVLMLYQKNYLDSYYIDMAIAWGLSFAYIKYKEKTLAVLKNPDLKISIKKKAISKCCDSFRVTKEDKTYLKTLK